MVSLKHCQNVILHCRCRIMQPKPYCIHDSCKSLSGPGDRNLQSAVINLNLMHRMCSMEHPQVHCNSLQTDLVLKFTKIFINATEFFLAFCQVVKSPPTMTTINNSTVCRNRILRRKKYYPIKETRPTSKQILQAMISQILLNNKIFTKCAPCVTGYEVRFTNIRD